MKYTVSTDIKASLISPLMLLLALYSLTGCGGSSGGTTPGIQVPAVTPTLTPVSLSGIAVDNGHFDPAPTADANGMIWMSYSHVSTALSGITQIETRLASTADAGLSWQDTEIINTATSLPLPSPNDVNAIAHETSRLIYNPFASNVGADPWIILWHRYLSVFSGGQTLRLFQHGWIGMKSGATASTLGSERKLFTGTIYDPTNNNVFGAPEYPLDTLYAAELGDCLTFSEPGILPKSNGIYVSLLCAKTASQSKIVLLHCDHNMNNCTYLGTFIDGSEAVTVDASYNGFSAPELVSVNAEDYLIITPTISPGSIYRGCVAYKITDLNNAVIERISGTPVSSLTIDRHGDFNGACAYIKELSGSGIIMSEAFFTATPEFRLFATGLKL